MMKENGQMQMRSLKWTRLDQVSKLSCWSKGILGGDNTNGSTRREC